jgi:phosphoribosyl 1,2-cyclic phosphodiesterase
MRARKGILCRGLFPPRDVCYKTGRGSTGIFQVCILASGSAGNCVYAGSESTGILIDAGLSFVQIERRLAAAGLSFDQVRAVLVTHEHADHVSGLVRLARKRLDRKRPLPIYLTERTASSIDWQNLTPHLELFQAGARVVVDDLEIDSFTVPHDAIDPVGFTVRAQGVKFSLATDLGYIPDSIRYHLQGSDVLLLESNHDLEMLKVGPYPWPVKQRVMSRVGHLSNDHACDFICQDLDPRVQTLILGHLSEQNNHPEIVRLMADQALLARGISPRLVVASQREPTEAFTF